MQETFNHTSKTLVVGSASSEAWVRHGRLSLTLSWQDAAELRPCVLSAIHLFPKFCNYMYIDVSSFCVSCSK